MTSNKIDIGNIGMDMGSSVNKNAMLIMTGLEISRRSHVPVLFLSNPGQGKTSVINAYAEAKGYHVESLILSQYSQDEILGFQANTGKDHLEVLEPEWFYRIWENKRAGKPSILFLDELSTVDGPRQGAGLQLCFERKIRGGKALPDDCLVVSAANYKANLPGYVDIISPTLNRFDIINLLPGDDGTDAYSIGFELVKEFTQSFNTPTLEVPDWNDDYEMDAQTQKDFMQMVQTNFVALFKSYTKGADSSKGILDVRNVRYDGIFDPEWSAEVYNFISGRTISYYARVMKAFVEMGVAGSNPIYKKFVDGLIGLGTNTWTEDSADAYKAQLNKYHEATYSMTAALLTKFAKARAKKPAKKEAPKANKLESEMFDPNSVAGKVKSFLADTNPDKYGVGEFMGMMKEVFDSYKDSEADIPACLKASIARENGILKFRADYEAIQLLSADFKEVGKSNKAVTFFTKRLENIVKNYEYFYTSSVMEIESDQL